MPSSRHNYLKAIKESRLTHLSIPERFELNERRLKDQAHYYFDRLWLVPSIGLNRMRAYAYLAQYLGMPGEAVHLGDMHGPWLRQVIVFSIEIINRARAHDIEYGLRPSTPHYRLLDEIPAEDGEVVAIIASNKQTA